MMCARRYININDIRAGQVDVIKQGRNSIGVPIRRVAPKVGTGAAVQAFILK